MALPSSGELTFERILQELGRPGPLTFDDVDARRLAGKMTGQVLLSDFYGKMLNNDFSWTIPGTYEFTVPEGVYWIASDVQAGSGGGGGGGGAGEQQWTASASGGGGGAGGKGQRVFAVFAVTPGEKLTIIVGEGGVGGVGGDGYWANGKRYGTSGTQGTYGQASLIMNRVTADPGQGGFGGQGAPGDWKHAHVSGGTGGNGYPAGAAGEYNHVPGVNQLAPTDGSTGAIENIAHGEGGISQGGGHGGRGGDWGNPGWENYSETRIGANGSSGNSGYVAIKLGTQTNLGDPASLPPFTTGAASVPWPVYGSTGGTGGSGGGGSGSGIEQVTHV